MQIISACLQAGGCYPYMSQRAESDVAQTRPKKLQDAGHWNESRNDRLTSICSHTKIRSKSRWGLTISETASKRVLPKCSKDGRWCSKNLAFQFSCMASPVWQVHHCHHCHHCYNKFGSLLGVFDPRGLKHQTIVPIKRHRHETNRRKNRAQPC